MDQIYCSREPWDSILGVNRPNGTSRTWNYMEDDKLDYPYTITKEMTLHLVNNPGMNHPGHSSISYEDSEVKFSDIEIHDIEDKYHVYPIRVHNHTYFQKNINTGFSCISPKVLEDVKNKKALIVVECASEGKYTDIAGTELKIIERWRIKAELPPFSVIVLSGNVLCEKIASTHNLQIKTYPVWEGFLNFFPIPEEYKGNDKLIPFKPVDSQKYFLSFNRQPRVHRILLTYLLWSSGIIDKGKVSIKFPPLSNDFSGKLKSEYFSYNRYKKFHRLGDRKLDIGLDNNLAFTNPTELYENTFISVVTETLHDIGTVFFSEKTWKPISLGHPFILVSSPNSLEYLRNLGFKTFSRWINEDYDSERDLGKRVVMINREIKKITTLSDNDLIKIRKEMEPILAHNKKLFFKYFNEYSDENGVNFHGVRHVIQEFKSLING